MDAKLKYKAKKIKIVFFDIVEILHLVVGFNWYILPFYLTA